MIIIKLGGTSISGVHFVREITNRIVNEDGPIIVVLSALSQVTNSLEKLREEKDVTMQIQLIKDIKLVHETYISELFTETKYVDIANRLLRKILFQLQQMLSYGKLKLLPVFGEYLSTSFYSLYLRSLHIKHDLKNSTHYIRLNENGEPDIAYIKNKCNEANWGAISIFQGFVCATFQNEITTLSRGGSDFTATLLGEALLVKRIEIWTDINGIRSNDPRFVMNTNCVAQLNYAEAAELAYFGAKILHPESVLPAQRSDVPIILKNSQNISHSGTEISNKECDSIVKAIAAKDNIILINITSYRMLMAHGFLSKIFDVFNTYKTSIDLITTSEVSVSLTIDNNSFLEEILIELEVFSKVIIKNGMSIISIIGNFGETRKSIAQEILTNISNPIEIMSYGTNRRNISILVAQEYKIKNLKELNKLSI